MKKIQLSDDHAPPHTLPVNSPIVLRRYAMLCTIVFCPVSKVDIATLFILPLCSEPPPQCTEVTGRIAAQRIIVLETLLLKVDGTERPVLWKMQNDQ